MRARNIILTLTFVLGCLLIAQGVLAFLAPQLIPFHDLKLGVTSLLLGLIVVQICIAIWMNRRLHSRHPSVRPFTWGYWNGLSCFLITPLMMGASAGEKAFVGHEIVLIPIGIFVLLRHRWAFIAATVLTYNPIYYVANGIYIYRRWTEMGISPQLIPKQVKSPLVTAQPLPGREPVKLESRVRNERGGLTGWQRAWVLIAVLWAVPVIFFAISLSPDSPARLKEREDEETV